MKKGTVGVAVGAVAAGMLVLAGPVEATLEMQKQAKAAGFAESANCLYCHNEKLPKKGAVTQNARGEWLIAEKKKQHAKEVDVNWLKYYPDETKK